MTDPCTEEQEDTIANPESRADVRLDALSLARLRYSFLQESACSECSFRLMLAPRGRSTRDGRRLGLLTSLLLRNDATETSLQHANNLRTLTKTSELASCRDCGSSCLFSTAGAPLSSACLHLTLPRSPRGARGTSANCRLRFTNQLLVNTCMYLLHQCVTFIYIKKHILVC